MPEANGAVHAIDVAARRTVAGVDMLWIVECKHWNRRVNIEKVLALQALTMSLGGDRGLLMSESGFQSGAIRTARQKNITLTSLAELRADAADELLAARFAAAEKSLMDLALRVNRDLRPFTQPTSRMLATLATRLKPEIVAGFAARPEAIEYAQCLFEVQSQVEGLTFEEHLALMPPHPGEMALRWRPGVDEKIMDNVALAVHYATEALCQGRLGQWPAMCIPATGHPRMAWSMPQLLGVIEPKLLVLEQKVAEQENKADQTSRLPWYDIIKPGTMPPPHPWPRGSR
jgi:hypothetical protein